MDAGGTLYGGEPEHRTVFSHISGGLQGPTFDLPQVRWPPFAGNQKKPYRGMRKSFLHKSALRL